MSLAFALNQVTLPCRDYAAGVAFYQALGLTQIVDSPGNGYARFETPGGQTLSIHAGHAGSDTVVYFECDALDQWCDGLTASGLAFEQMPRDESWGWREARLLDPSGNIICLYRAGAYRRFPPWRLSSAPSTS